MTARTCRLLTLTAIAVLAVAAAASAATPEPALSVTSLATPTNFKPGGEEGVEYTYDLRIANLGAEATDGTPIMITDTLPEGVSVKEVTMFLRSSKFGGKFDYAPEACHTEKPGAVEIVICEIAEGKYPESIEPAVIEPVEERRIVIALNPPTAAEGQALDNHVVVQGGGSAAASTTSHGQASAKPAPAGVSLHSSITEADGLLSSQAAAHPYQLTLGFAFNTKPGRKGAEAHFVPAGGDVKDIQVGVPAGLVGNLRSASRCSPTDFNTSHSIIVGIGVMTATACPDASTVGAVLTQQIEGVAGIFPVPLYNLNPPPGVAAQFGAPNQNHPVYIVFEARPDQGYKVIANLRNLTQLKRLTAATTIVWGTPGSPLHDGARGSCLDALVEFYGITIPGCEPAVGLEETPFLRLPTSCIFPLDIGFSFDSWSAPGAFTSTASEGVVPSGCNQVHFEPSFEATPTTEAADSPSGLQAKLEIPQNEEPEELGEADLRKTVVTLPQGMALNPASANGLEACSAAQIGFEGKREGFDAFSNEPAHCPPASRIGTVKVKTPLVDHTLESGAGGDGSVYIATPHENPFNSLLAIYLAVHDPKSGAIVKLAGEAEPNPITGQITTSFDETPQLPFEDFELSFFGGPLGALRTPALCGKYTTTTVMTPWSAPESGPPLTVSNAFQVSQPAAGQSSCPHSEAEEPNKPAFEAGTLSPVAGAYTPFVLHLRREDGSQQFSSLSLALPPGLIGRLAGVSACPEAALAAAERKSGKAEQSAPSCPAASQVGSVRVGAGAGPSPYYTGARAYLAGRYKGAPLSLAIVTPAVAGPYDLGTVVVRAALSIDPETGQVSAQSDPFPQILQGIPLDVRSIAVKLDRPNFTLNPTNCDPLSFSGQVASVLGQAAPLSQRFQVGECKRLKFAPKLSLKLSGSAKRGGHPALRSVVTYPKGAYANIAKASVALPHSEFLAQNHIRTICTRVQFAAHACPARSIYGHARATSPLVDYAVEGPVYLRSSSHPLPDLVLALRGPDSQPIEVDAVARIDSIHGGIRATFDSIPDLPVSKFVLSMQGGAKGLLENSTNICAGTHKATAKFTAQNGKYFTAKPALEAKCPKRGGAKKHKRS
jgi:hypothetical protein